MRINHNFAVEVLLEQLIDTYVGCTQDFQKSFHYCVDISVYTRKGSDYWTRSTWNVFSLKMFRILAA